MSNIWNDYKFYQVLGCSKSSTHEEIKRAYRKMALLYHPDKNSVGSMNDKFLEVEEAWRILSDPESKRKYDAECRQSELEYENILVNDRIRVEDMKDEGEELMSYPCRCGSNYFLDKSDFRENEKVVYIACEECTFSIAIER